MSQKALKPAYAFAHQNPGDPRPWLLLGRAYAQLDWYSDAVERYVRAHSVDSTCRGDPQMLADLLKAAAPPGPSATFTAPRRFPRWKKRWSAGRAIAKPPHASPGCATRFRTDARDDAGGCALTRLDGSSPTDLGSPHAR